MTQAFLASAYLAANPDLVAAGITEAHAYEHYRVAGYEEGRPLSFDAAAYKEANPDLQGLSDAEAIEHFLAFGRYEDRLLSVDAYLLANPDLVDAGLTRDDAAAHFAAFGREERRLREFDADAYRALNPDLAGLSDDAAARHFVSFRFEEERLSLDGDAYLVAHPDVALAGVDPAAHYVASGAAEGRSTRIPEAEDHDFSIVFDYRFDTDGFFDDPERRAALEAAADIWEDVILDDFPTVPAGTELIFPTPGSDPQFDPIQQLRLTYPVDDVVIFVGSEELIGIDGSPAAGGAPRRSVDNGDSDTSVAPDGLLRANDEVDYMPSHGTMVFNPELTWDFSIDAADLGAGTGEDFVATAIHEIGHVLGITTTSNNAYRLNTSSDIVGDTEQRYYAGPAVLDAFGQRVPLTADGHYDDRLADGTSGFLEESTTRGLRDLSIVDLAILRDIGYAVEIPTGVNVIQAQSEGVTLVGDLNRDSIGGSDGADSLFGGVGGDTLMGGSGDDTLSDLADTVNGALSAPGADFLDGGPGDDSLFGGAGDDFLVGNLGDDTLDGGLHDDTLVGGAGDDLLFGDDGSISGRGDSDSLVGGDGNDTLFGGTAGDTLDGGAGSDVIYGDDVNEIFVLGGLDYLTDGPGDTPDTLFGGIFDDTLIGSAGPDSLDGGVSNDRIENLSGDATIRGGQGNDYIVGVAPDLTSTDPAQELFVYGADDALHDTIEGFTPFDGNGAVLDRIDLPEEWVESSRTVTDGNLVLIYTRPAAETLPEVTNYASITLVGITSLSDENII
ncbi:MAG: hypothetical protein NXI16_05205 [Alphaproteobacteria bacterium]|nr:hypothetical protein [Alphaproteobacteria bacterium]